MITFRSDIDIISTYLTDIKSKISHDHDQLFIIKFANSNDGQIDQETQTAKHTQNETENVNSLTYFKVDSSPKVFHKENTKESHWLMPLNV